MSQKPKKCPACEVGVLVGKASSEAMPFRHAPAVVPAHPVDVPTCTNCATQFIDAKTAKAYDEALQESLDAHQQALVSNALERLSDVRLQRQWEKCLGLSPGYFSRLKSGKDCSVPLMTLLALLAESPVSAWERVARIWTVTSGEAEPTPAPVIRLVHSVKFDAVVEVSVTGSANVMPAMRSLEVPGLTQNVCSEAA